MTNGALGIGMVLAAILAFCLIGYLDEWREQRRVKREKIASDAAAIREACADYDRLADEAQRKRQGEIIDGVRAREAARNAAPIPPRLEDGARWLDME